MMLFFFGRSSIFQAIAEKIELIQKLSTFIHKLSTVIHKSVDMGVENLRINWGEPQKKENGEYFGERQNADDI